MTNTQHYGINDGFSLGGDSSEDPEAVAFGPADLINAS